MNKAKIFSLATILSLAATIPNANALEDGQKFKDWTGKCETVNGSQLCTISQAVTDGEGRPQAAVIIGKIDEKIGLAARVIVPLLVNLRAGLKLVVDGEQIAHAPYSYCDPIGCSVIVGLDNKLVSKFKAGSKLTVSFIDMRGETSYPVSLSGITSALNAL